MSGATRPYCAMAAWRRAADRTHAPQAVTTVKKSVIGPAAPNGLSGAFARACDLRCLCQRESASAVASKVFIDQVLWNPIFGVMFFSYVAALEGKGPQYVVDKTKKELLTSVSRGSKQ